MKGHLKLFSSGDKPQLFELDGHFLKTGDPELENKRINLRRCHGVEAKDDSVEITTADGILCMKAGSAADVVSWTSVLKLAGKCEVAITMLDGTEFEVDVRTARNFRQVKQAIGVLRGWPAGQQILQDPEEEAPLRDDQDVPWDLDDFPQTKALFLQLLPPVGPFTLRAESRYNANYFCVVSKVSFHQREGSDDFLTGLRVEFDVRGDMSMGALQDPLSSKLNIVTGSEDGWSFPPSLHWLRTASPSMTGRDASQDGWSMIFLVSLSAGMVRSYELPSSLDQVAIGQRIYSTRKTGTLWSHANSFR